MAIAESGNIVRKRLFMPVLLANEKFSWTHFKAHKISAREDSSSELNAYDGRSERQTWFSTEFRRTNSLCVDVPVLVVAISLCFAVSACCFICDNPPFEMLKSFSHNEQWALYTLFVEACSHSKSAVHSVLNFDCIRGILNTRNTNKRILELIKQRSLLKGEKNFFSLPFSSPSIHYSTISWFPIIQKWCTRFRILHTKTPVYVMNYKY